jgi:hypothetical protein
MPGGPGRSRGDAQNALVREASPCARGGALVIRVIDECAREMAGIISDHDGTVDRPTLTIEAGIPAEDRR